MSEERKPVICPWCGRPMIIPAIRGRNGIGYKAAYRCTSCKISAPFGAVKSTWKEAEQAAYLAAKPTPNDIEAARKER